MVPSDSLLIVLHSIERSQINIVSALFIIAFILFIGLLTK
jgi:hypothetical protein